MKDLFIDCSAGVSGDMLLAGFLDLGVPSYIIDKPLDLLGLRNDYSLKYEDCKSFNLRGVKVFVEDKCLKSEYSNWADIRQLINNSELNNFLKKSVLKVFNLLAEAEAYVHGIDVDMVHFHEVGAIDSIVDITGVCAAVEYLNLENIFCNFPAAGSGFVETSHGVLPVPVPAVLELARRHKIKLFFNEKFSGELTTPTGLALLIALADFVKKPSSLAIDSIGIGLGHKELDRPNLLRIFLLNADEGSSSEKKSEILQWEEVVLQQAWIDDASPEDLAILTTQLRNNGAIEVASQSIQMKKGRIGVCLTAITLPSNAKKLRMIWLSFGTTIGLRENLEGRWVLPRRAGTCTTEFGEVRVKQVRRPNGNVTFKIEHDELSRISLKRSISVDEVRKMVSLELENFQPNEDWK